jgi:hypothetical protein
MHEGVLQWVTIKWNGTNVARFEVGKVINSNDKFGVTL